jgi:hypothetical protein
LPGRLRKRDENTLVVENEEASWAAGAILVAASPFLAHAYAVV